MIDSSIIFYLGHLQPVRAGDLLRVVSNPGWRLEGKIFLVTGGDDKHEVATGIVDGKLESLRVANLEAISEF